MYCTFSANHYSIVTNYYSIAAYRPFTGVGGPGLSGLIAVAHIEDNPPLLVILELP